MQSPNPELDEFMQLVATMRTAQTTYFRTRDRGALETSRQLERTVDKRVLLHNERKGPQQEMFGGETCPA